MFAFEYRFADGVIDRDFLAWRPNWSRSTQTSLIATAALAEDTAPLSTESCAFVSKELGSKGIGSAKAVLIMQSTAVAKVQ
jgi:hypothetical protein